MNILVWHNEKKSLPGWLEVREGDVDGRVLK